MPALVVLNGTNCIATEDDGLTWAVVSTLPSSSATGRGAGFSGAFYLHGTGGGMRSSDAVTWVAAGDHGLGVGAPVLYNGSVFLATRQSPDQISRSTDGGQTWSAPVAAPIRPVVVGVIGSTFCLMDNFTANRSTSADGITWSTGAGGLGVSLGPFTTSFSRNRIITVGSTSAGATLGNAFTADGTTWTEGGVIGMVGDLGFSGVAFSGDGVNALVSSQSGQGTFRSANGGVSWSAKVNTTNFQNAAPMWVGTGTTFIISISSGGLCERTTDGGATWSVIANPGSLNIASPQTASFVLPAGLPVVAEAFWTNRIRTSEII